MQSLRKPYLLFLGGVTLKSDAKTGFGLRDWCPADVIGQVEDPAQRNALAMKVLGKSYDEVMPLLAQGGDALRAQAAAAGPYAERMVTLAKAAEKKLAGAAKTSFTKKCVADAKG